MINQAKKAAFYTLGCKVNQYDTEAIQAQFKDFGYEIVDFQDETADVYVINTCTVTNVSDGKSRQIIRRAHRNNPEAKVVVVGCLAQTDPEQIKAIEGVNLIIGTDDRHKIPELVNKLCLEEQQSLVDDIFQVREFEEFDVVTFPGRTRASLKIQDGCSQFCSYCKVPHARGPSRSRIPENVIKQTKKIVSQGYSEIVLTGVHLGAYGQDLKPTTSLKEIIGAITLVPEVERVRISSVDPNEMDLEFLEFVVQNPKVCRHLHIPLQSGSDAILKRMRRRYKRQEFLDIYEQIKANDPGIAITTDLIVGFPGETEELFQETYNFLQDLELTKIHVFKFSPRKGTPAAGYPQQVTNEEKTKRSQVIMDLSNRMSQKFNRRLIGQTVQVLVETVKQGQLAGLTDNYIHVTASPEYEGIEAQDLVGKIVKVKITNADSVEAKGFLV